METIANDITEFDVYKSSRGYVKSNTNKHSVRSRNSWKVPVQVYNPLAFKSFNTKRDNRIKTHNKRSISYIVTKEILRDDEMLPAIKIELKGNVFFISKELKEIAEEIAFSEELSNFDENCYYEKTLKISEQLYFVAINFLIDYSEFILKKLGVVIQAPEINAGRNGNVYLAWRTDKARLGISIENNNTSEIIANYYGDLGNDIQPIKGNVNTSKVSEYLAYWMKYLT